MSNGPQVIQSLKAVDAWIDVINANINGGVRTAFKASRLRFGGTNVQLDRAPTSSTLPLQLPEPGLITTNTVIDWTQGAITSSTETTHLAIQGRGFFVLNTDGVTAPFIDDHFTRDGEFHTDAQGYLIHNTGLYLYDAATNERVWNDIDTSGPPPSPDDTLLSEFLTNGATWSGPPRGGLGMLVYFDDPQTLLYSRYGSTVYEYKGVFSEVVEIGETTILAKSLEASNSSMTQSVPELSLAQKLFSALTKVLQTGQTNLDSVLNLVR